MPTYQTSILISASPAAVWNKLSNVADWANWLPTITSIKPLDDAPLSVGSRYAIVQPKLQPATWTVTLVEPPHRFVWESRAPGMLTVGDHVIEESQPGTTKVTLSISFSGFISGLIGLIYGSLTQSYLETEAKTLKQKIELPAQ
jgi:uncharacterized membrane protein